MAKSSRIGLRTAERYLEQGELGRAERLCRKALAANARDAEALNLMSLVAARAGRLAESVTLAREAVAVDETNAVYHDTLGDLLTREGRYAQAILTLQRALGLRPDFAQAHLHLGDAYAACKSPAAAEDEYRAALTIWSDYPEVHHALGRLLHAEGRGAEAVAAFEAAVRVKPGFVDAWLALGEAHASEGDREGALEAVKRATESAPRSVPAWLASGRIGQALGHLDDAASAFRRGLELAPEDGACLLGLAALLEQARRFEEAVAVLRPALTSNPARPELLKALSRSLFALGQLPEAEQLALRAAELAPRDADAYYAVGNVQLRMQRPAAALAAYRNACVLAPQSPKARFALASPLLMLGDLHEGWDAYEARLAMPGVPWKIANPLERLWNGGEIGRQRLLVHTEQGLGDTLQFIRYLPLLRSRVGPDAHITLLCEPAIGSVAATVDGYDALHQPEKLGNIEYDLQVPLLSLAHRFGTTLDTMPAQIPYIGLPRNVNVHVERAAHTRLAVAFAWAGRPTHGDDRMRSCAVESFAALFNLTDVHFFSIQVGPRAADIEPWLERPNVTSMSAQLTDLAQTLSVIDQVDLVIAVDTSVVHLAGAYGKPVWTLLAHGGEWRWLLEREDTPWYPTMRLIRQRAAGDWDEVFSRVRTRIERMLA